MATVRLDAMLREFLPRRTLSVEVGDVRSLLDTLESDYPRLRRKIRDETGSIRRFIRVFVNGEAIDPVRGLETPIGPRDEVDILHSIQGG